MNNQGKWRLCVADFVGYMFDAAEIIVLTLAIPVLMPVMSMSTSDANQLATATLLGIGGGSLIVSWYADNHGRRKALLLHRRCRRLPANHSAALLGRDRPWRSVVRGRRLHCRDLARAIRSTETLDHDGPNTH
jgi:hypothetical protein